METFPAKTLLMKVNLRVETDPTLVRRLQRLCFGAFLMGWQPGSSFFKFGVADFYTTAELEDDPVEMQWHIGLPTSPRTQSGDVMSRQFERGWVGVNLGGDAAVVTGPSGPVLVPAHDAVFDFTAGQDT